MKSFARWFLITATWSRWALLGLLLSGAFGISQVDHEPRTQHWAPATPVESLVHQLDQAADLDAARGVR